jgi:long-chain acyl-CoA synthetase
VNIANHFARAAHLWPDNPAVARGATTLSSYRVSAQRIASLAGALQGAGLAPGDRVALVLKNCPEYLELMYACWHAGLVAVPVNAKLHRDEFAYILHNSGARVAFASTDLAHTIGSTAVTTLERIIEVPGGDYAAMVSGDAVAVVERQARDAAWLFYTSGTTGRPKGATLTHRNLLAMCLGYFCDVDPGAPWSAFLHAAPMSHGSGLYGIANVMQGACHVIPESSAFEPLEVYELIRQWPGMSFFAAPTMVKRLLDVPQDFDTRNLKLIMYGGGPMYVADSRAALARFGPKLSQLYGQGESPMCITALSAAMHAHSDHPRWEARLASVGTAQAPVAVRVVDSEGTPLPVGEVGEITVKGDSVMQGYWGNAEASAEALRDGWLHTGDVGSFDEDGFLTLKDRSKDMIISGGTNIYPREVEEVLLRHPQVTEVSVIGRADREWGEVVVAYVVASSDADSKDATVDVHALDAFCVEHMARFKRPKDYRFVSELPKNNYGKVLKTALRESDVAR